ncbi:hypothetical protein [Mastigocoleus testarum]|uniref:hypothetical protein n=1 Tax=Mastigocoleus testarum TaxID=996925 RepID=UPI000420434C|nr:hypothetical protein [Mastigocoleus testarum]
MNHRFLLRLVTNFTVYLLTLSCFAIVLWVIDEVLRWDILPDAWSLLVRALLVAGGIIAFVLVVMNVILSLALLAEANASRALLPNYHISARLKRRIGKIMLAAVLAIALLFGGLEVITQVRTQSSIQTAQAEFNQTQNTMDRSAKQVLGLFTQQLLEAIDTNTLAEKGELGNLRKLLNSIQASFPNQPSTTVVIKATQAPYEYASINANSIKSNKQGQLFLSPQLYTGFPTKQETQIIKQLFSGKLVAPKDPLKGSVIKNTIPSSWGLLKRNNRAIAVVYLEAKYSPNGDPNLFNQDFHHNGPASLLTN